MDLDERKFRILQAIVDDYILTAVPVGSRTISRKQGMGLSSATIRNEMSDLEELGYLDQPHTSAGRVPSYRAYRLYVDQLMQVARLSRAEMEHIRSLFNTRMRLMEDTMERAAKILSDLTNYTSIIMAPQAKQACIERVQLVPISEGLALVIIVTDIGVVKDVVMRISPDLTSEHLHVLSNVITEYVQGKTPAALATAFEQLGSEMTEHRVLFANLLDVLDHTLLQKDRADVVLGGTAKLLNYPEYANAQKARAVLSALETKENLAQLLDKCTQMEFSITIGPEFATPGMNDASLVTVSYRVGRGRVGTMGVIGPTRMDYARVLAVLSGMRQVASEAFSSVFPPGEEGHSDGKREDKPKK